MQKITPFLWFDGKAEEAANFYCSVFKNSKLLQVTPMISVFEIEGQKFMALNGGPQFKFTEAVSLFVECETQNEVDYYWNNLTGDGGSESMCGWLKDKYGLSWQIIPNALMKLMSSTAPKKSQAVIQAMLKMKKIVINDLEQAYNSN